MQNNHGQTHGLYQHVNTENGQCLMEENYFRGQLHGRQFEWDKYGEKRIERKYYHGLKHGYFSRWDEWGKYIEISQYRFGRLVPAGAFFN